MRGPTTEYLQLTKSFFQQICKNDELSEDDVQKLQQMSYFLKQAVLYQATAIQASAHLFEELLSTGVFQKLIQRERSNRGRHSLIQECLTTLQVQKVQLLYERKISPNQSAWWIQTGLRKDNLCTELTKNQPDICVKLVKDCGLAAFFKETSLFVRLIRHQHLEQAQQVLSLPSSMVVLSEPCQIAAEFGQLSLLQILNDQQSFSGVQLHLLAEHAVKFQHPQILQWIVETLKQSDVLDRERLWILFTYHTVLKQELYEYLTTTPELALEPEFGDRLLFESIFTNWPQEQLQHFYQTQTGFCHDRLRQLKKNLSCPVTITETHLKILEDLKDLKLVSEQNFRELAVSFAAKLMRNHQPKLAAAYCEKLPICSQIQLTIRQQATRLKTSNQRTFRQQATRLKTSKPKKSATQNKADTALDESLRIFYVAWKLNSQFELSADELLRAGQIPEIQMLIDSAQLTTAKDVQSLVNILDTAEQSQQRLRLKF
jgi:hypothetical protein